jgi:hypothetical protein
MGGSRLSQRKSIVPSLTADGATGGSCRRLYIAALAKKAFLNGSGTNDPSPGGSNAGKCGGFDRSVR